MSASPAYSDWQELLAKKPYAFDFYQVARLFQNSAPGKPCLGSAQDPADEVVRFSQVPHFHFAPAEIKSLEPSCMDRRAVLRVYFFGLLGPNGPMPEYFKDLAFREFWRAGEDASKDKKNGVDAVPVRCAFTDFLDLFHHRVLSLLFRVWASVRPVVDLERDHRAGVHAQSRFLGRVGTLCGLSGVPPEASGPCGISREARSYFAGRLASATRNAEGLSAILSDFFSVPVRVEEAAADWVDLPPDSQGRLGASGNPLLLGRRARLGLRSWDAQLKIRVVVGPADLELVRQLVPGGSGFSMLAEWVRIYTRAEVFWEVHVQVREGEDLALRLSSASKDALGRSTWLSCRDGERPAADFVLGAHCTRRETSWQISNDPRFSVN